VRPAAAVWAKRPEERDDFIAQVRELDARIFARPDEFAREMLSSLTTR
jgi:hypothetical protein